jgi:steroid 5-alpha reductase family enzyme
MTLYNGLIGLFWLLFILVWAVSAMSVKKGTSGGSGIGWRIAAALIIFWIFKAGIYRSLASYDAVIEGNPSIHLVGVIVTGFGIAFAIWARLYLGKNWGMPMSVKEDPALVTKGPYAYVRHPIYFGILTAMLGSALASSVVWIIIMAFAAAYFVKSAKKEEQHLSKEFADRYKKRTKMLIPFVY